jgi:hypothetical protein
MAQNMRIAQGMVARFSHQITSTLGGMFTAGAVMMGFDKFLSRVEEIDRLAETFSVSKGFVQDLQNWAVAAGVGRESIERMLKAFADTLPAGADVQEEFLRIADVIQKTVDPIERVQIAVENFGGKVGTKLLPLLMQGSDAVRKLGEEFSKLSETDIATAKKADAEVDRVKNSLATWFSKLAVGGLNWMKIAGGGGLGFGNMATLIAQEKAALAALESQATLEKESAKLAAEQDRADAAAAYELELLDKGIDADDRAKDEQLKKDKARADQLAKHKRELATAEAQFAEAKARVHESIREPGMFTIGDLARDATPAGAVARRVSWLREGQAFHARMWRPGIADRFGNEADRITGLLGGTNPYLRDPTAKLIEQAEKQRTALDALVSMAKKEGINIRPVNGE